MIDVSRNGPARAPALLGGAHTMVSRGPGGRTGSGQAHPEWTIVLPLAGPVEWWTGQCSGSAQCAAGVIFPPRVGYVASSTAGHISVLIAPWFQGLGPGQPAPIPLDHPTAGHLLVLWSRVDGTDLDEIARETVSYLRRRGVLPSPIAIDPRVGAALRNLHNVGRVDQLAAGVGLSTSRLRALVNDLTGMPPTRLRMWQRLRAALLSLPDKPIALAAADAGFADQSHLTRTATRLVGQTPGELARMLRSPRADRDDERPTACRLDLTDLCVAPRS